jgi:hypothetical protein
MDNASIALIVTAIAGFATLIVNQRFAVAAAKRARQEQQEDTLQHREFERQDRLRIAEDLKKTGEQTAQELAAKALQESEAVKTMIQDLNDKLLAKKSE